MRGHRHTLLLIGQREARGALVGKVVRDAEGRWVDEAAPTATSGPLVTEHRGFIGYPRTREIPQGVELDAAAQFSRGTVIPRGSDVEAVDTGDPNLDGRYEVVGVQPGHVITRVLLKKRLP